MRKNYLALGGLFACLHVLFLFISRMIVGSELLLVLFLPLLSTLYTLKSDKRNVVMFVIATFLVCAFFDFIGTFIYVVPSLICGVVYGFLRKNKYKELELLGITGIVHMFTLLFSFFVIALLFKEVDFIRIFESIFDLTGDKLVVASSCFLMVLGFCEAFLVHIVCDNELEKLSTRVEKNDTVPSLFLWAFLVSFVIFIVLYFVNNLYSVIPMILSFVFLIPYIVYGIMYFKYKILTISLILLFSFASVFLIGVLEPLNLFVIPFFVVSPVVINNFKDKKEKNF